MTLLLRLRQGRGKKRQALCQDGEGETNEKSAEDNVFRFCSKTTSLGFSKKFNKSKNLFLYFSCFWKYGHNN